MQHTIRYKVRCQHAHRHFIQFEALFASNDQSKIQLQLAAWRPGRYELGNFSKNIRAWNAYTAAGEALPYRKLNKDLWEIDCEGQSHVIIRYEYYAAELNAGSSYLDESMLYINPVNCFFYDAGHTQQAYEVHFELPEAYRIACGLRQLSPRILTASNFDELADCPLIASDSLHHLQYESQGIPFHIWIQGEVKLDVERTIREFKAFSDVQMQLFGSIPCKEYHFLFHFTPVFVRHGVEHRNSTVIAMGPASEFQQENLFRDLLGISCHELFHTWNIKNIRPAEMMPYDFTKENYSRLGYVAEGVTTYYGDLLLWTSGAFTDEQWLETLNKTIQTHLENPGRFNHSVADSSFDTWLDGYGAGIPWRKVSIYNEGSLIALLCDLRIIAHTTGQKTLDDVMRLMYDDFGKKQMGYTETDYRSRMNAVSDGHCDELFDALVNGHEDYLPYLTEALQYVGLYISSSPSPKWAETNLGLSVDETPNKATVQSIVPESPADAAGLWIGDEILAINGTGLYKNFHNLMRMSGEEEIRLTVMRKNHLTEVTIKADGGEYARKWSLAYLPERTAKQEAAFKKWKVRFTR